MQENKAITSNPHWIGDCPAWDITLSNGVTHFSVTKNDISKILQKLHALGLIGIYDHFIDVVREKDIQNYNKFYTSHLVFGV